MIHLLSGWVCSTLTGKSDNILFYDTHMHTVLVVSVITHNSSWPAKHKSLVQLKAPEQRLVSSIKVDRNMSEDSDSDGNTLSNDLRIGLCCEVDVNFVLGIRLLHNTW